MFTPGDAGPNPERKMSANNVGNLKVVGTVKDGDTTASGEGRLVVAAPLLIALPAPMMRDPAVSPAAMRSSMLPTLSLVRPNLHLVEVDTRQMLFHVPTSSLFELDEVQPAVMPCCTSMKS